MIKSNERICILLPKVAIIKIATSKNGMENTMKEYNLSKDGKLRSYIVRCRAVLFGGAIGIYDYASPIMKGRRRTK